MYFEGLKDGERKVIFENYAEETAEWRIENGHIFIKRKEADEIQFTQSDNGLELRSESFTLKSLLPDQNKAATLY